MRQMRIIETCRFLKIPVDIKTRSRKGVRNVKKDSISLELTVIVAVTPVVQYDILVLHFPWGIRRTKNSNSSEPLPWQ